MRFLIRSKAGCSRSPVINWKQTWRCSMQMSLLLVFFKVMDILGNTSQECASRCRANAEQLSSVMHFFGSFKVLLSTHNLTFQLLSSRATPPPKLYLLISKPLDNLKHIPLVCSGSSFPCQVFLRAVCVRVFAERCD